MRTVLRWVARLAMLIVLLPFAFLVVQGCKPSCAVGAVTLRAEDPDFGDLFKQSEKDKKLNGAPEAAATPGGGGRIGGGRNGGGSNPKPQKCGPGGGGNIFGQKDGKKKSDMFGANGARTFGSRTIYERSTKGYRYHMDIENLDPGKRPATLHVQIEKPGKYKEKKYEYNKSDGKFYERTSGDPLPRKVQKDIDDSDEGKRGLERALRDLGEGEG